MSIVRGGFGVVLSGCFCPSAPALAPPSQPVGSSELDSDISELLARELACWTKPEAVVVTPSPPTPDLDALCAAFRAQPPVGEHKVGCELYAAESEQLWEVHVATSSFVGVTVAGLGVPAVNTKGVVPASGPALRALGVDPESFRSWLLTATRNDVRRIVRRPVMVSDPYHGQPGLVVRTDIGFELEDRWLICMDKSTSLLDDNDPIPPEGTICKPRYRPGWWTCAAP